MDGNNSSIKVLVTGASGFLGSHCCKLLQERGYQVRGTVRSLKDLKRITPLRKLCPEAAHQLQLVEADLLIASTWDSAVDGCTYVLHVASPISTEEPEDEQQFIAPAVHGTLNVLKACHRAKCVKRVILTSSVYAIAGQRYPDYTKTYSEADWTDMNAQVSAYTKSKTLAERAAWDFVQQLSDTEKFELVVINPSFIMGPVLHGTSGASQEIINRLMKHQISAIPLISLQVCDVRDVAEAHIKALTGPEVSGNRHIITSGVLWFRDCAFILHNEFSSHGYRIPTVQAPRIAIWLASRVDKSLRLVLPRWGKQLHLNDNRMKNVLGIRPRPLNETVLDMTYSMIERGFLPKAPRYKRRGSRASGL